MEETELGPLEKSWGSALAESLDSPCLTAGELIEFVEKGPKSRSFGRNVEHLSRCPQCARAVREMRASEVVREAALEGEQSINPFSRWLRPLALTGGLAALAIAGAFLAKRSMGGPAVVAQTEKPKQNYVAYTQEPEPEKNQVGSATPPHSAPRKISPVPHGSVAPVEPQSGPAPSLSSRPAELPAKIKSPHIHTPMDISKLYCMIGDDHCFEMPSADADAAQRQEIEEAYADHVAVAQRRYTKEVADHGYVHAASIRLNDDLNRASAERDKGYGTIYVRRDDLLEAHPELRIEAEAPYQAVELDLRPSGGSLVTVGVVVHEPWPGYRSSAIPFGWSYGFRYTPRQFKTRYSAWRERYVAEGHSPFVGLIGHSGPILTQSIVGSRSKGYAMRVSPSIRAHDRLKYASRKPRSGIRVATTRPRYASSSSTNHKSAPLTKPSRPGAAYASASPSKKGPGWASGVTAKTAGSPYLHSARGNAPSVMARRASAAPGANAHAGVHGSADPGTAHFGYSHGGTSPGPEHLGYSHRMGAVNPARPLNSYSRPGSESTRSAYSHGASSHGVSSTSRSRSNGSGSRQNTSRKAGPGKHEAPSSGSSRHRG